MKSPRSSLDGFIPLDDSAFERLTEVVADLEFAAAYWDDLTQARLPLNVSQLWHGLTLLSAAAADERDTQAWIERLERSTLAIGESPAPLAIAVLDTTVTITREAGWLAGHLAHAWGEPAKRLTWKGAPDPRPALMYAARRLVWLVGLYGDDAQEWIDWAAIPARRMVADIQRTLSLRMDGQFLPLYCPWCTGAIDRPTWRIYTMPSSPPQIAIVCEGECEPPLREVDTWWNGRPCWLLPNWQRLARRLTRGVAA